MYCAPASMAILAVLGIEYRAGSYNDLAVFVLL